MGGGGMTDDAVWKRRFFALMLARLIGTLLALSGLVVAYGDVVRTGGYPALGILLIIAGLIALAVLPILLRRRWRQP
jgi:hypothetical protein